MGLGGWVHVLAVEYSMEFGRVHLRLTASSVRVCQCQSNLHLESLTIPWLELELIELEIEYVLPYNNYYTLWRYLSSAPLHCSPPFSRLVDAWNQPVLCLLLERFPVRPVPLLTVLVQHGNAPIREIDEEEAATHSTQDPTTSS